jgi:hypothetical protein
MTPDTESALLEAVSAHIRQSPTQEEIEHTIAAILYGARARLHLPIRQIANNAVLIAANVDRSEV